MSLTRTVISGHPNALCCGGCIASVVWRYRIARRLVTQIASHSGICTDPRGVQSSGRLLDVWKARRRTVRRYNYTIGRLLLCCFFRKIKLSIFTCKF